MVLDINAYLGEFGLRRLRYNTPDQLVALMDRKGIDAALVSAAQGIMWKDCHEANRWLSGQLGPHSARLMGCAVINPAYAGWETDLAESVRDLGMRAVKVYPHWHGYQLNSPPADALCSAAGELGLPVLLPVRAVDRRQLGWVFDVPDLALNDIADLVSRHPDTSFVILEGVGFTGSRLGRDAASLPRNYWIEVSRIPLFIGQELVHLTETLGADRLMFGTGMPFKYVDPVTLKLSKMAVSDEDLSAIRGRNAERLLGLGD